MVGGRWTSWNNETGIRKVESGNCTYHLIHWFSLIPLPLYDWLLIWLFASDVFCNLQVLAAVTAPWVMAHVSAYVCVSPSHCPRHIQPSIFIILIIVRGIHGFCGFLVLLPLGATGQWAGNGQVATWATRRVIHEIRICGYSMNQNMWRRWNDHDDEWWLNDKTYARVAVVPHAALHCNLMDSMEREMRGWGLMGMEIGDVKSVRDTQTNGWEVIKGKGCSYNSGRRPLRFYETVDASCFMLVNGVGLVSVYFVSSWVHDSW